MTPDKEPATAILRALAAGDAAAGERLYGVVYDELRALAARHMRGEREGHTLQPTALVHEAFIRLVDADGIDWQGKAHFMAIAATTIRRVLIEHARARAAHKRGGGRERVTLDDESAASGRTEVDLLGLDDALSDLAERDPRRARVVELRFFGGMSVDETAAALGVSPRTVKDDWRAARAWLRSRLTPE